VTRRRPEPRWLSRLVVDAIHYDQLREHGGLSGVRDENVVESTLARPKQKWRDAARADLPTIAAAYAFGLLTSHPYRDGNKRIGFLAMVTFLGLSGYDVDATEPEVVTEFLSLADGRVSEKALADWIRQHSAKHR
jgi:death-on-curing protein